MFIKSYFLYIFVGLMIELFFTIQFIIQYYNCNYGHFSL